jgi:hypothetical protein
MGVWQGIYEAHLGIVERKDREKELQQARDDRARERQEDRDFARNEYNQQVALKRMEATLPLLTKLELDRLESGKVTKGAEALLSRLSGYEDHPLYQAYKDNPQAAAEAERQITAKQEGLAAKGQDYNTLFNGAPLLEFLLPPSPTGEVDLDLSLEGILGDQSNFSDTKSWLQTTARLTAATTTREQGNLLSVDANFVPDSEVLEEARNFFESRVFERAVDARDSIVDRNSEEWLQLNSIIDISNTEAGKATLKRMFGDAAAADLLSVEDNTYIQHVMKIPELKPYIEPARNILQERQSLIEELDGIKAALEDPNEPEGYKQELRALLNYHGIRT